MASIPVRKKSATRIPDVDPKSPAGAALTTAVQDKLRQFLGADYTDRSLAQYVVVMLAHKTEQEPLGDNLVEFLGEVDARELASWLFEHLSDLLPKPDPQQQVAAQQAPQPPPGLRHPFTAAEAGAAGAAGAAQASHEQLELELEGEEHGMEAGDGDDGSGDGGSDADTAEVLEEQAGGRGVRRLQSAVVRDTDYRRRSRSRSHSRSPRRHRSSHSPGDGRRRHSPPPRRRSPPRYGRGAVDFFYAGSSGARFHGHDPYPHRQGWRGASPPPHARRRSHSPPGYPRSLGHGRGRDGGWAPSWSPRRGSPPPGAYREGPPPGWGWGGPPHRLEAPGGASGVFARMQPYGAGLVPPQPQQHFQHDLRWEEERQYRERYRGEEGAPAPPPGLTRAGSGREAGAPAADAYDAGMGQEHLGQQQGQQGQAQQQQQQQQLAPWERPSYMDLELQRQQQAQHAQQPTPQSQQATVSPGGALGPRAAAAGGEHPVVGVFARALTQAAASLGFQGRSVTVPASAGLGNAVGFERRIVGGSVGGGAGSSLAFQVTISAGDSQHAQQRQVATPSTSAPLLTQPDLQLVLRQRLRHMELELVELRAANAERQLADVQRQQELSAAAKLDITVRSICIRGVHPAASERVLIAHFGACGYIQQISFLRDPVSGRKTGVAYMQFSSAAQAQAALALDGSSMLQRTIQVVPSDSPAARVAVARVMRASYPPPGLVAMPFFAASVPPPRPNMGRSRFRGRGQGSFKYMRPADQPGPGSASPRAAVAVQAAPEVDRAANTVDAEAVAMAD